MGSFCQKRRLIRSFLTATMHQRQEGEIKGLQRQEENTLGVLHPSWLAFFHNWGQAERKMLLVMDCSEIEGGKAVFICVVLLPLGFRCIYPYCDQSEKGSTSAYPCILFHELLGEKQRYKKNIPQDVQLGLRVLVLELLVKMNKARAIRLLLSDHTGVHFWSFSATCQTFTLWFHSNFCNRHHLQVRSLHPSSLSVSFTRLTRDRIIALKVFIW